MINFTNRAHQLLVAVLLSLVLGACSQFPQPVASQPQPESIRDYAHQLSTQLMDSGKYVRGGQRIAVTTPAWLEGNLDHGSLLALQLQENLAAELHSHHMHVIDFKLTDGIRVTQQGDFALSRNYLELRELQSADYILAATAVDRSDGITINARLIEFDSQIVAATAEVTVPRALVEQLRSEQGVELVAR
ncbi:FlgO family outer membrane protein [Aliidiomarina soli]|uniref:FlgO domain-containing protein n=1 Tax=Aliidiomarina soli TaxID=1928574 RepID=A0A432WCB1_9GAMM|nr:FlgO family outer membrane protein [Aliidiomarina soli]RUO29645.1 hypothetical protein CWE14_14405 [Aliidiomarina soli]